MKHQPKLLLTLACVASLTLTSTWAQRGRPAGGPPAFAHALPEVYGILEAADADGNNKLDADEQAILIEAMKDGTLTKPDWVPDAPEGVVATHEGIVERLTGLYAALAPYDADDNGAFEGDELSALRRAFMTGKIRIPFQGAQEESNGRRSGRPFGPFGSPHGIDADKDRTEGALPFASVIHEMYANIATLDTNNDGKLDEIEQEILSTAIEEGLLTKPEGLPRPPEGVEVSTGYLVKRLAGFYARISKLDTNGSGKLNEEELQAIRNFIQRPDTANRFNRSSRRPFGGSRPSR